MQENLVDIHGGRWYHGGGAGPLGSPQPSLSLSCVPAASPLTNNLVSSYLSQQLSCPFPLTADAHQAIIVNIVRQSLMVATFCHFSI